MMTEADDAHSRQVVRQLGHLIEITRIIDRNREDGQFATQSAEPARSILYVFDTNVVQMFLEPSRNPQFAETFHGSLWGDSPQSRTEINAQSCLLAAEFLMSGKLPGQTNGRWYMSEVHTRELNQQLDFMRTDIKSTTERLRTDENFKSAALDQLEALNSALEFGSSDERDYILALARRSGAPVDSLRKLSEHEFKQRAIGIRSREACRLLALDRIIEPRDQLRRFHSPEINGSRLPLEQAIGFSETHRAEIRRAAAKWHDAFAEALSQRAPGSRTEVSIRADCETLALIEWGNARIPSHQRIVFVTGDKLLLDAYRGRYVNRTSAGPFILRPISYFCPLFNPTSAESYLPKRERDTVFARLQEAIEGAMVALNLSLLSDQDPQHRLRARDHFTYSVEHDLDQTMVVLRRLFPQFFETPRLNEQSEGLNWLVGELRNLELLLLEAYPHLVAHRLEGQQQNFLAYNTNIGLAIDNVVDEGLQRARRAGFSMSLVLMPQAVSTLLQLVRQRSDAWPERALVPTRLSFSSAAAEYVDYLTEVAWLSELSEPELAETLTQLTDQPPMVFALAAMLAFSLEFWRDAARYSMLALSATEEAAMVAKVSEDRFEYLYLAAVSQRFRLAAWEPAPDLGYSDPWKEWHIVARSALTECVTYHAQRHQLARHMRALSERASLNVSYCEWLVFGGETTHEDNDPHEDFAFQLFMDVVRDLELCLSLAQPAQNRADSEAAEGRSGSAAVLQAATKQYTFNILSARLVGEMLAKAWPARAVTVADEIAKLRTSQLADWPEMPDIAKAYVAAARNDYQAYLKIDPNHASLALDRIIIFGLARLFALRRETDLFM